MKLKLWHVATLLVLLVTMTGVISIVNHYRTATSEKNNISSVYTVIQSDDDVRLEQIIKTDKQVIFTRDDIGNTFLHDACFFNSKKCIVVLLRYGMDINAYTYTTYETPLYEALVRKDIDEETVKYLVSHGANIDNNSKYSVDLVNRLIQKGGSLGELLSGINKPH